MYAVIEEAGGSGQLKHIKNDVKQGVGASWNWFATVIRKVVLDEGTMRIVKQDINSCILFFVYQFSKVMPGTKTNFKG